MTDITLPEDTTKSRLNRPVKPDPLDDAATAGERIEAFWDRYPEGSILTEVEPTHNPELLVSIYTVRAFVRKNGDADRPDATAHATRSTADPDAITAQFPQETAETSAISRALRNLGILATPKRPDAPTKSIARDTPALAAARKKAGLSQKQLAETMGKLGHQWTQAIVSKIENGNRALAADEAQSLREIGVEVTP